MRCCAPCSCAASSTSSSLVLLPRKGRTVLLLLLSFAALAATWLLLPGAQRAAAVAKAAAARALSFGNVDGGGGWAGVGGGGGGDGGDDGSSADNLRGVRNVVASDFLHADRPQHWTWKCDAAQSRCVRKPLEKGGAADGEGGVSLLTCQMTCDPPLWPRPTGMYSVGTEHEAVQPHLISFEAPGWSPEECRWLLAAAERARARVRALQPPSVPWGPSGAAAGVGVGASGGGVAAAAASAEVRAGGVGASVAAASSAGAAPAAGGAQGSGLRVMLWRRSAGEAPTPTPHPLRLALDTNESYRLRVTAGKGALQARVTAATFFGARHALETLVQLMWWDGVSLRVLSNVSVSDAPRFPYRGLMLDTARNFFPLASLRATVDMMAANKLNAFHWHLSDSHSFPFASRALPRMAEDGAYAPTQTYSPDDVAALVQYALRRGVRVLPEVDAPAHTAAGWRWGPDAGLGALVLCVEQQPWQELCGQPPCGQLNPDNEHTYAVLGKLYRELLELSQVSDLFHLGGDEVNPECWRRSLPNITTQEDFMERWRTFEERALVQLKKAYSSIADGQQRKKQDAPKAIVWSSHLTGESQLNPSDFVVQVWGVSAWREAQALLSRRYRVILSHLDAWYLDCGLGDYRSAGDAPCNTFITWQRVYEHAPWQDLSVLPTAAEARKAATGGAAAALQAGVLGGEACLWTERTDHQVLDSRLWPRASAFAERLWSDPPTDSSSDPRSPIVAGSWSLLAGWQRAHARLAVHRERMVAWGVRADTMQPAWCTQNPGECW